MDIKNILLGLLIFSIITIAQPGYVWAGAWTVPEGHWYTELYTKYYWHDSKFDDRGDEVEWAYNGEYHEVRSELKLEYGFRDNLNFLIYLPFKYVNWKDDFKNKNTKGIADIWVRGKYRFKEEPFVFSGLIGLKIPTGYDENKAASLGDDQVDVEIKALIGKTFPYFIGYSNLYLGAEAGFRGRNEEPCNEIPYLLECGFNPTDNLMFKATINGVKSLPEGGSAVKESYTKWNVNAIYKVKGGFSTVYRQENSFNIELGYGETFAGKNSSVASEAILNFTYQF